MVYQNVYAEYQLDLRRVYQNVYVDDQLDLLIVYQNVYADDQLDLLIVYQNVYADDQFAAPEHVQQRLRRLWTWIKENVLVVINSTNNERNITFR